VKQDPFEPILSRSSASNGKLGNEAFVSRAPPELIAKERDKVAELQGQVAKLTASLAATDRKA